MIVVQGEQLHPMPALVSECHLLENHFKICIAASTAKMPQ